MISFQHEAFLFNGSPAGVFKEAKIEFFESYHDGRLNLRIYPDIPVYARNSNYTPENLSYNVYVGAANYRPVPNEYKITGYANDTIFIDALVSIDPGGGSSFEFRSRFIRWIDACGYYSPIPKKYEVG